MQTSTIDEDREYEGFLERISGRFAANVADGKRPIFTTSAEGLFDAYLGALPEANRQYHTCHACRSFMERFGGVVTIDESGAAQSAIWNVDDAPDYYRPAVTALLAVIRRSTVTGVFLSSDAAWGVPQNPKGMKHGGIGSWTHLHVRPPSALLHRSLVQTPGQAMAEKREDRGNVARALGEFPKDTVAAAVKILQADALYRAEKALGPAEWLLRLHEAREAAKGKAARENVLWLAIAQAPAGFCHPRSSMIGTLLEDLAAGKDFEACAVAFKAKMHPLRYQRPQAAPSAGNIKQAEELVAKLGIAPSLERRFARLDEIEALWRPTPPPAEQPAGSVFGHLQPKGKPQAPKVELPQATMTWEKFARTVLGEAVAIELEAPRHGNYTALLTAVHPDAPPILQWDSPEQRNPVSLYVWHGGSSCSQWGIFGWTKVNAITTRPSQWFGGKFPHQAKGVIFVLEGARETRTDAGAALFPENLQAELHAVRATIEAYSRSATPWGATEGSACGLLAGSESWNVRLRVTDKSGDLRTYLIDRED